MFDTILLLPLFQGITRGDLTDILAKAKLHFAKYKNGEVLLTAGTPCRQLLFVLRGEVTATAASLTGNYQVAEHYLAPYLLEPQSLFGMDTTYQRSYAAKGEVHTVSISKEFVMSELFNYEIFRLNYLNMLSHRAQLLTARLWTKIPPTTPERVNHFLLSHFDQLQGEKIVKITMDELAQIVADSRINVSHVLNALQKQGMVELRRGEIRVIEAEKLLTKQ